MRKFKLVSAILLMCCSAITGLLSLNNQRPYLPPPKDPAVQRLGSSALPYDPGTRSSTTARPGGQILSPPQQVFTTTNSAPKASLVTTHTFIKKVGDRALAPNGQYYPLRTYNALSLPNDPQASQPWVTATNMASAWNIPRGNHPTLLAIIDTGVALKHEEFQNRWYTNPGESGPTTQEAPSQLNCTDRGLPLDQSCNLIDDNGDGIVDNESGPTLYENPSRLNCTDQHQPLDKSCNLIDDDHNGLVDDVHGWDFNSFDNSVQAGEVNPAANRGHHATYVTGVAAATSNNGVGIAGVDGGTTILPIQALDDSGTGSNVAVANAIYYAASLKADVINLSLGSTTADPLVRQAVQAAIAAGSVVVAAAGNDGCDCMVYPANYPEVLAVGAADNSGQLASFSSYGANLDILAPGVNLYTTDWLPSNQTSAYVSGISGTSLATPIISGLLTRLKSLQPNATPLQLIAALTENTNRLNLPVGVVRSDKVGFDLVDAGAATQRLYTSYAPSLMSTFGNLSLGNFLSPSTPSEFVGSAQAFQCAAPALGSTPVYELVKPDASFFTASILEKQQALDKGFNSSFFGYTCLSQPQDKPSTLRLINLLKN